MKRQFVDNPYYAEYESLLRDLACLQAEGKVDSPLLDSIYEEMQRIEPHLCHCEIDRLNGLSADLYMLEGRNIRQPLEDGMTVEDRNRMIGEASEQRDWDRFLQLLRKGEIRFPPHFLAYVRGCAYRDLGHVETALIFLKHACVLDPNNEGYRSVLLDQLNIQSDLSEAAAEADAILGEGAASPMLRLQAGVTLFMSARDCALTERRSVLERAAAVLRKALDDAAFSGQADVFTASGWVTLGRCYANLQRFDDARQAFDSAIGVIPDYPEALVERAFLYKGSDPARALRDFQAAIQAGSPFLTPYLHVAYDALQTGDFDQCRKLCHRILRMGPTRQVRAVVYHWVAICEYQERRSEQTAREYLRKALLIDPLNDAIRADNQRIAPSSADGSLIALDGLRPGSATRLPGASADTWRQLERAA